MDSRHDIGLYCHTYFCHHIDSRHCVDLSKSVYCKIFLSYATRGIRLSNQETSVLSPCNLQIRRLLSTQYCRVLRGVSSQDTNIVHKPFNQLRIPMILAGRRSSALLTDCCARQFNFKFMFFASRPGLFLSVSWFQSRQSSGIHTSAIVTWVRSI